MKTILLALAAVGWSKEDRMDTFGIGKAVKVMMEGGRVTRPGWNGKGMWLELQRPDEHSKMTLPYVYMRTAQGDLVPWLASQTDILAVDWMLADPSAGTCAGPTS